MRYENVCLEALGYCLPEDVVTSTELEGQLAPLYDRLGLSVGRLELMTGIVERRFWAPGVRPSEKSIESCERALEAAGIDRRRIGALVHGSVCRDFLEPATASAVHHHLGLSSDCTIYDVSNACLGLLNGLLQVANMIELGQIEAGLVVGTEVARPLVEATIETLNRDSRWTRRQVKSAIASLTIGSASCAMLLVNRQLSRTQNRLDAAAVRAHTQHYQLCCSDLDQAGAGMRPLMETDSQRLLQEGVAAGVATFEPFLRAAGRTRDDFQRTICHQVGGAHRKLMLEQLGLSPERDYSTFPWLGNTGAAALPITLAVGLQEGELAPGDSAALLGIGSGVNCVMVATTWQKIQVATHDAIAPPHFALSKPQHEGAIG